ncbi:MULTISPECIES: hypothetical protein [Flavobacterium]|uniref:Uncharacterized protein n=1 Tax=Flavobacterium jumunjinense TaxID=998845 RepID=A0ABV5GIW4_9FLAO|nr:MULTISPECIES: hypothetical protein [Flavobacterium]
MKKSILMFLVLLSCASSNAQKVNMIGCYVNNDSDFCFDNDGNFTYYDYSIYRSDVNIVFCNEWSKGTWKIVEGSIQLNSEFHTNPIKITITKTIDRNLSENVIIDFRGFKENYKIFLAKKNSDELIEVNLNSPSLTISGGDYYFKLYPFKENLEKSMIIKNENFDSDNFTIKNDENYIISIDFPQNIFAFRTFNNYMLKVKKNAIIFDKWKYKKKPDGYKSKLSKFY